MAVGFTHMRNRNVFKDDGVSRECFIWYAGLDIHIQQSWFVWTLTPAFNDGVCSAFYGKGNAGGLAVHRDFSGACQLRLWDRWGLLVPNESLCGVFPLDCEATVRQGKHSRGQNMFSSFASLEWEKLLGLGCDRTWYPLFMYRCVWERERKYWCHVFFLKRSLPSL